jgi:hypothetical protein
VVDHQRQDSKWLRHRDGEREKKGMSDIFQIVFRIVYFEILHEGLYKKEIKDMSVGGVKIFIIFAYLFF